MFQSFKRKTVRFVSINDYCNQYNYQRDWHTSSNHRCGRLRRSPSPCALIAQTQPSRTCPSKRAFARRDCELRKQNAKNYDGHCAAGTGFGCQSRMAGHRSWRHGGLTQFGTHGPCRTPTSRKPWQPAGTDMAVPNHTSTRLLGIERSTTAGSRADGQRHDTSLAQPGRKPQKLSVAPGVRVRRCGPGQARVAAWPQPVTHYTIAEARTDKVPHDGSWRGPRPCCCLLPAVPSRGLLPSSGCLLRHARPGNW